MLYLLKKLIILLWKRPKHWRLFIWLEIGSWFIRRGAAYQVGQPFILPVKKKGRTIKKTVYIKNLYFNFKQNKITHSFSDKPIPGLTEKFTTPEKTSKYPK